jgi:uncharacterized protein Veg
MAIKPTLSAIRKRMSEYVGSNVELICHNRRKLLTRHGVLEGAYGSVFTVMVCENDIEQRLSYTYSDVLTNSVTVRSDNTDPQRRPAL